MNLVYGQQVLLLTVIITAMVAMIIGFFFVSIFSYHKRYMRLQRDRIFAEITMQENERRRIANDLHDGLGPLLATVKMKLRRIQIADPGLQDHLEQSVESLEETISSLRLISYNLLPQTLENHGLCEAVAEFSERVNKQHQLGVEVDVVDRPAITKDREIRVFRIIQEITHNTIKHAGAKLLQIIFKREGKDFLVLLRENGIGFNVSDSKLGSQGLGLKSIESRSEVLEGTLKIESEPGKGTNYVLRFSENPAILAS